LLPAAEEQDGLADDLAVAGHLSALLDEASEGCDTGTGADHDDRLRRVGGELEVRVADVDRDVDAVILVARSGDGVVEAVRVGVRVTVLLLLQGEEVVGCDTLDYVRCTRDFDGLDDGCDGDLLGLDERGGRDGVVARLDLVQAFDEDREGDVIPRVAFGVSLEELSNIVVLAGDLGVEVVLVATNLLHLSLDLFVGGELRQAANELTGKRCADLHVEANGSVVGGRRREWNLGGSIETLDSDDSVPLAVEVHDLEKSVNLLTSVRRPDSNVISSGVRKVRARDVDFHV